MALQRLHGAGASRMLKPAQGRAVSCCAINQRCVSQASKTSHVASQLLAAGLALGISLAASPAVAAPPYNSLADIVRSNFDFIDENKDGIVTKDELLQTAQAALTAVEGVEFMMPEDNQIDFAMKLFDLNQDGTLATDELLSFIALNGAVSDEAIDADVVKVFDRNGDGFVSLPEFKSGVPPLGPNGEAAKEYIFSRVNQVVSGDSKLGTKDFASALTLMRRAVLGY